MASGVTTEWDDLQVRFGTWAPREKLPTTEENFQANLKEGEAIDEWKHRKLETLNQLCEDNIDLEDDEYMK